MRESVPRPAAPIVRPRDVGALALTSPRLPRRLAGVLEALLDAGGDWALARPPGGLPAATGDIDLLVAPGDVVRVRDVLRAHGFTPLAVGHADEVHAVDYDAGDDRFLWFHVQPALRLGGERIAAREPLATAVRDPLPRLDDPWLLWTLLLHGLVDRGGIAERHREDVRRLASAGWAAPAPLAALAGRRGLACPELLELAAAGAWERLEALPVDATTARSSPAARVLGALRHGARTWRRRGISVAVLGPDGAGKTTLVGGLHDGLPGDTRVLYMGLTGGRLPRADALRVPGVVLAARLAIIWVRWGVALGHRLRGRVVVFDRYVLDGTVPSGARLTPLGRASRRLQAHACPSPDVVLVLDASGGTLHRRSEEYDAAVLESWRAAYRRLQGRVGGVHVIDAEQPADAVLREAKAVVWRSCAARWAAP